MGTTYPAVFARGGTSKALIFHRSDLPQDRAQWDRIFMSAMGTPDPNGRQLNGMGGGISSLSKICIVARSDRPDADVDYTFAQVGVHRAGVDYNGNCGNMSAAIGPFAVDEGLVAVGDGEATVRIFNTNTGRVIHATFPVRGGKAVVDGELAIPGVAGTGAPVRLDFLQPGGASTGRLLPTGRVCDRLEIPGVGVVEASLVDAANACVFVDAKSLGLAGTELPDVLESNAAVLARLADIRVHAAVAMGLSATPDEARSKPMVPFIAFVSPPADAITLSGEKTGSADVDLTVRMISNGQPHRALPLTASLCTAVAANIAGTLVNQVARRASGTTLRLGMPSGVMTVAAEVTGQDGLWVATRGSFYRTTRRLFEGRVYA
jgi:2-methylaconitate cis-trans-isomerase PrpF